MELKCTPSPAEVQFTYSGLELDLFAKATHWKQYWSDRVIPYLVGDILEIGSGIGTNTRLLRSPLQKTWLCLEPDGELASRATSLNSNLINPTKIQVGTIDSLSEGTQFDAILYIDVLEHINDDTRELEYAFDHLKTGGKLVILSPAHQFLFSEFDSSIGHYRRYSKSSLSQVVPKRLKNVELLYLDSVGFFASLLNRYLLKKANPSEKDILFWDRKMVTVSQKIDPILGYGFGKTVLGVWEK